jgi:hypothetical protein
LARQPLDRAGHAHRGDDGAVDPAHAGAHRRHTGLALLDGLDPARRLDPVARQQVARRAAVEGEERALRDDPAQAVR